MFGVYAKYISHNIYHILCLVCMLRLNTQNAIRSYLAFLCQGTQRPKVVRSQIFLFELVKNRLSIRIFLLHFDERLKFRRGGHFSTFQTYA